MPRPPRSRPARRRPASVRARPSDGRGLERLVRLLDTLGEAVLTPCAPLNVLVELDAAGFLTAPGESLAAAFRRGQTLVDGLRRLTHAHENRHTNDAPPPDGLLPDRAERIPDALFDEAGRIVEARYAFRLDWAPGYFVREGLGPLWGGCAIFDPAYPAAALLLRDAFRHRDHYGIYGRDEIIAHELCHLARVPLNDHVRLEEFFAYQTSPRRLRRYLGNCFSAPADAAVFALPAVATATAQSVRVATGGLWSMAPFWIATAAGPLWLLLRNQTARNRLFHARAALTRAGVERPDPVLFRALWTELPLLTRLAHQGPDALMRHALERGDWRWRVMAQRFFPQ